MAEPKLNQISIVTVLKDHNVELFGQGDNLKGFSPFRVATSMDSFTVCLSKNTFHDWKLDLCGGPVKFVENLFNLDQEAAEQYLLDKYYGEGAHMLPPIIKRQPAPAKLPPLNPDVLDKAYGLFLSVCTLADADRDYLKDVRHLTDDEIDAWGFKTFPMRSLRKKVQKLLLDNGIDPATIPGFFRYKDDEFITWSRYVGIIIPIRNIDNKIVGLQVRKTKLTSENDSRYVWFSSAFAVNKPNEEVKFDTIGRSPESPVGVVMAAFEPNRVRTLFITEGFFKAIAIRKNLKSPSITIQGITNWKGIRKTIQKLREIYPKLNRVIFALDADLITNLNVSAQMTKIWKEIQMDGLSFFAMLWDVNNGKGIDDLFESVGTITHHMGLMPMEDFNNAFIEFEPEGKSFLISGASDEEFANAYRKVLAKHWKGK